MSEDKKGLLDKEYTRRQFLKMSGKGIAGLTLSATMLSLFGCTQKEIDSGAVAVVMLPVGLLVANRARCTGCQRCETNCSLTNDGKAQPFLSRVKVRDNLYFGSEKTISADYPHQDGIFGTWLYTPETCKQCKDAKCMEVCPAKAIAPDPTSGARVIDVAKCIGCGACTTACPWGMPTVDSETKKSTKCINCGACAEGCPTGALKIVPWEDVAGAM